MKLTAIVAMSANRVIGREGRLPWHYPEDLKFFKKTTLGHPVLMGRATFDSIIAALGKPLPGRQNIVLSRTMEPREDVTVIRDVSELPAVCPADAMVFVIGGAQVFADLLPACDGLYLTLIDKEFEGDVFLPSFDNSFILKEIIERNGDLEFRYYERAGNAA
ncbi:MAG: dihydrofolate reductase [Verrucomicrobiaceae bacterium]|nr:dihydrofolate reductase [Verrucomicrobiaceae bacterium]